MMWWNKQEEESIDINYYECNKDDVCARCGKNPDIEEFCEVKYDPPYYQYVKSEYWGRHYHYFPVKITDRKTWEKTYYEKNNERRCL